MSQATADKRQLEYIPLRDLDTLELRDIRGHVVEDIAERIRESEYNPARPMRVVPDGETYAVVDGNHRLTALRGLDGVSAGKPIPCVVEAGDADVYALSHASNQDEDTYAEEDLFDHLDFIADLREDETQAEIAERLGWSKSKVKQYSALLNNVVTDVLQLARAHQDGRVTDEVTSVTFSEYWFRTSGLYDLNREGVDAYATRDEDDPKHAQVRVMEWFVHEQNCDATKRAVQRKVEDVAEVCDQLDTLEAELNPGVGDATRQELREEIIAGTYTDSTLESAIENANQEAKDRAVYGTGALDGLATVESDAIDCVVTDPPYGEGFESVRPTDNPEFDDGAEDTFELLDRVFAELQRVCKANAHLYVFFSMTHYERIVALAEEYFEVERTPLIWAKNRHAPNAPDAGGFEKNYAQKYEPVLHLRMPKGDQRALNGGVSPNMVEHAVPDGDRRRHDTQKPRSLLAEAQVRSSGWYYIEDKQFGGGGAPMIRSADGDRIRPDFSVLKGGQRVWIEVKGKTEPATYEGIPRHGINHFNWQEYQRVADLTDDECWLFVYEQSSGLLLCRNVNALPVADERIKESYDRDDPYGCDMVFFNKTDFNVKHISEADYPEQFFGQDKLPLQNRTADADVPLFPDPPETDDARGQASAQLTDFIADGGEQ